MFLGCQIIAATEAPILAIVLGIIGGIVLLGLLLLLAWKLIVTAYVSILKLYYFYAMQIKGVTSTNNERSVCRLIG